MFLYDKKTPLDVAGGRVNGWGSMAGVNPDIIFRYNFERPWWHFIYNIPRKW